MLKFTRRIGESFTIEPSSKLDPEMTVRELFALGPIVVIITGHNGKQTRLGINAPRALNIVRSELHEQRPPI